MKELIPNQTTLLLILLINILNINDRNLIYRFVYLCFRDLLCLAFHLFLLDVRFLLLSQFRFLHAV